MLVVEAQHEVGGMTATIATLPTAPEHKFNEGATHTGSVVLTATAAGTRIDYTVQSTPTLPFGGLVLGPVLKFASAG